MRSPLPRLTIYYLYLPGLHLISFWIVWCLAPRHYYCIHFRQQSFQIFQNYPTKNIARGMITQYSTPHRIFVLEGRYCKQYKFAQDNKVSKHLIDLLNLVLLQTMTLCFALSLVSILEYYWCILIALIEMLGYSRNYFRLLEKHSK